MMVNVIIHITTVHVWKYNFIARSVVCIAMEVMMALVVINHTSMHADCRADFPVCQAYTSTHATIMDVTISMS